MPGSEAAIQPSVREKASWFADLPGRHVVGRHVRQNTLERLRIWEVRRYCQAKPALLTYHAHTGESGGSDADDGDYALTAILRCLVHELRADIAHISLLDDETQYFLAGAVRSEEIQAARAANQSTQWYGCDSVLHAGGLCTRTIRLEGDSALYEELDMSTQDYTRSLPFVNGQIASFRWYAGVPLVTSEGYIIGTVFLMANEPAQTFLPPGQHKFLCNSAQQVMKQLDQAVQAIEGRRLATIHAAVTTLARVRPVQDSDSGPASCRSDSRVTTVEAAAQLRQFYQHASQLMLEGFELSAVFLQETPSHGAPTASGPQGTDDAAHILGGASTLDGPALHALSSEYARQICKLWPDGEIFSRFKHFDGSIMSAIHLETRDEHPRKRQIEHYLAEAYPEAEQLLVMPMWDPLYDRATALTLGIARGYGRVYTRNQDLHPIAAFCTSIVHHAHRLEANHMEQRKSDFLGSISHEMRSPLHGMLANLELALDLSSCVEQRSMLQTATSSGRQLLTSIDKVLDYAQISATSAAPETTSTPVASADLLHGSLTDPHDQDGTANASEASLLKACETIVWLAVLKGQQARESWQIDNIHVASPPSSPHFKRTASMSPDVHHGVRYENSATATEPFVNCDGVTILLDMVDVDGPETAKIKVVLSILQELVTNALTYTSEGCIRISLQPEASSDTAACSLLLCVEDCGRGMHGGFLKHQLFVPFSQEDQIDSGTGLGLSLTKQNVESLGGTISVESTLGKGTKVRVDLPKETLAMGNSATQRLSQENLPRRARLYSPPWPLSASAQKAHDMVEQSLSCTLWEFCHICLLPSDSTRTPELLIVTESDLAALAKDDTYPVDCPRLILCSASKASSQTAVQRTAQAEVTVASPILPSRLIAAISQLSDNSPSNVTPAAIVQELSSSEAKVVAQTVAPNDRLVSGPTNMADHRSDVLGAEQRGIVAEQGRVPSAPNMPSILLVDDNLVNLKVLAKYVERCGIHNPTLVAGGQEAIDAFRDALHDGRDRGFDVVFMDLSMPTVSGFDATRAIRQLESENATWSSDDQSGKPASIVALTGLVSAKDRKAAFDAGVTEYLTKPADLVSIRGVIRSWELAQSRSSIVDGYS